MEEDSITRAVKKYFPVFEKHTGWRLHGKYEPMEHKHAQRLMRYFQPFNEMLFALLGERFTEWEQDEQQQELQHESQQEQEPRE